MPAITVDDITTLQRLPQIAPTATRRRVRSVTTAPGGLKARASRSAARSRVST